MHIQTTAWQIFERAIFYTHTRMLDQHIIFISLMTAAALLHYFWSQMSRVRWPLP
jgi:hypothetical protein